MMLHHPVSWRSCAVWNDADQEPGTPVSRTPSVRRSHGPRKRGDGRGSEVSLGGLGKDHLIQREIRNSPPQPGILCLQFLQALYLIALQSTVFGTPSVICNFRNTYRTDRFRHRFSLRIQHVNLTELRDDLFCLVCSAGQSIHWIDCLSSSNRCHFNVLLRLISHTSKRITFQGAD